MNWTVAITDEAMAELESQFKGGLLTREDAAIIKVWRAEMEAKGPDKLRENRTWNDHDLDAGWRGYRSSCFSQKGRIIYRVLREQILIEIVKVTGSHDYRK